MYTSLILDFSRVLIFSRKEVESLNAHHKYLQEHVEHYRVLDHFYLNEVLLTYLRKLPDTVHVYLFSDGALHNLPDISASINGLFERIITAEEAGFKKSDPNAYKRLIQLLGIQPEATVFLDDKAANVNTAEQVGFHGVRYENNEQAIRALQGCFTSR